MNIIDLCAQPQHLETIAAWHHSEWSHLYPGMQLDSRIARMAGFLEAGLVPTTFVAVDGDVVLGSAAIIESDMDTRPTLSPWLASVYVDESRRGQGVGSRLVKHVMAAAQREGIEKLYLFTEDRVAFYERLGWQVLAREDYHGESVTVMEVNLERSKN